MYRTHILNNNELIEFNKNYGVDFKSVIIKQEKNKFYAILDCDLKVKLYRKEATKYFV